MNNTFLSVTATTAAFSKLSRTEKFIQHGNTSCLLHSIAVAYYCYRLSTSLHFLGMKEKDLIRGALLHDYFLYDWHKPNKTRPLHGRYHPKAACANAEKDFCLTEIERDIIIKHMFPLTFSLPHYKESTLVCIVDKCCSVYEIFKKSPYKNPILRCAYKSVRQGA